MTPLDKYGDKALKPEEQEEAEKQRAAKAEGTDESVYGPTALAGEGDREKVERAADRAGMDVPEHLLEEGQSEPPESGGSSTASLDEALDDLDEDEPPEDYDVEHEGGGYYSVTDPDGEKVPSPDTESGNWQGKQLAVAAAHSDYAERQQDEEPEEEKDEAPSVGPDEQVSVEKLEEILEADPGLLDSRMHAEFARAEGPRQEALEILLEVEQENQNRDEVVQTLSNAVEGKPDEGDEE